MWSANKHLNTKTLPSEHLREEETAILIKLQSIAVNYLILKKWVTFQASYKVYMYALMYVQMYTTVCCIIINVLCLMLRVYTTINLHK